MSRHIFSP